LPAPTAPVITPIAPWAMTKPIRARAP